MTRIVRGLPPSSPYSTFRARSNNLLVQSPAFLTINTRPSEFGFYIHPQQQQQKMIISTSQFQRSARRPKNSGLNDNWRVEKDETYLGNASNGERMAFGPAHGAQACREDTNTDVLTSTPSCVESRDFDLRHPELVQRRELSPGNTSLRNPEYEI